MSDVPLSSCSIYKTVATLPEELSPNAIYLVRTGYGFDIYATDSQGIISHKHNGIAEKYFQHLAPTDVARGRSLSILVPYLFNTKNGNNWNTGFTKILEGVKKHKLLKFYPILDLLTNDAIPEANGKEAVDLLNGYGATPLAYVKLNEIINPVDPLSVICEKLTELCDKYGSRIGIYLHATENAPLTKYILSAISMEMSKRLMFPLVVYTENTSILNGSENTESMHLEGLTNNSCGDIFIMHNNVAGSYDTLYQSNIAYPYLNKGMLVYGCATGAAVKPMLDKFGGISTICISSATTPTTIHTSTLPSYFESYLLDCTNHVTRFENIITNELIGSVTYFATSTIPQGWLLCNGSAINREVYGRLFEAIGTTYGSGDGSTTFNLPDLRGMFIRGLDLGRGVDVNRTVGTGQADGIKYHTHLVGTYQSTTGDTTDSVMEVKRMSNAHRYTSTTWSGLSGNIEQHYTTTNRENAVDFNTFPTSETRPVNLAMYPCIKY